MDHTSRTGIYASVQGSKGGALAESSTMTSDGLLEHFSDKQTPWGTWELNIPHFVRPVLTDQYCAAQVEFTRRHWHWQVYQWCLTFFIDESICTLSTFDRHQRICGKHYAACISSVMICNDLWWSLTLFIFFSFLSSAYSRLLDWLKSAGKSH